MPSSWAKVLGTIPLPFSSVMHSCDQLYSRSSKLSVADCLSPFLFHFHIAGFLWSYTDFNLPSPLYLFMLAMAPCERQTKLASSSSPQPSSFWEVESTKDRPRREERQSKPDTHPKVLLQSKQHYLQRFLRKVFEKTKVHKCEGREAQTEGRGEHCAVQRVPGRTLGAKEAAGPERQGQGLQVLGALLRGCCLLEILSLASIYPVDYSSQDRHRIQDALATVLCSGGKDGVSQHDALAEDYAGFLCCFFLPDNMLA